MRRFALAAAAVLACAPVAEAKLVFEREDGSTVPMAGAVRVWCGPWSADVPTPALHVGIRRGWHLAAVRADLVRGKAFRFPHSFAFDRPTGAQLFAVDGENEASTAEEEASGRLFFSRISCRPGHRVAFRIRATLGSEVSGPAVSVAGTFRGRVGTRTWPVP